MENIKEIFIPGQIGYCGSVEAFLGFSSAQLLHRLSFTDVLNEETGEGYQRPRNIAHSLSFRRYITQPRTSTITLTFNLRQELSINWRIQRLDEGRGLLCLRDGARCLAQVDCQHRLGELDKIDIPLAFMAYIGLDLRAEMALFNVINSRARGLSSSLTDYHESNLLHDLAAEAPHLYIARKLNEDPASPWYKMIRYGGETNSGLKRRTSLRMMQKSIQRFLRQSHPFFKSGIEECHRVIISFWKAVKILFPEEWNDPRHSLLTKGVGLYSLMLLLADLVKSAQENVSWDAYFLERLRHLKGVVDWASKGTFSNAGGQKGALQVYYQLKQVAGI
jgi:DNA sulfur modification protein DndB